MSNNMEKIVKNIFGVSRGDEKDIKQYKSVFMYLIFSAYRSFLRLLANHCIIPSLRVILFRWSGINIGKRVQINMNVNFLDGFYPGQICLEDEVSVAPFVSFVADSHPNNSILGMEFNLAKSGGIVIKNGAWIGVGSVILPGIIVGKAAIVGSNAVVTKNVGDYTIVAGVPAKIIGDVRVHKNKVNISRNDRSD